MALSRFQLTTLWALVDKEKQRIARRGRRTSESSMEFEKRASQYDDLLHELESMTQALGPLPGLHAPIPARSPTNVRVAPDPHAPKRLVRPVRK